MGTVTGRIIQVGGPSEAPSIPVRGVVTLTNVSTGVKYLADAKGKSGFSVQVPVGTYRLTGRSEQDFSNGHEMTTNPSPPVRVRQGTTSRVNLYISIS